MKDSLQIGIENEMKYTVTADMAPGHLPITVLSTPSMIELIEIKKRRLLFEVEVLAPKGPISTGTHERAVVDLARLAGG